MTSRYYVEIRDVDGRGWNESVTTGYLDVDGRFIVDFDLYLSAGDVLTADEMQDVVLIVSYNNRGQLRDVNERKQVAALAERHGYKVVRGSRAKVQPEDFVRIRGALRGPCPHDTIDYNDNGRKQWPYRCKACKMWLASDQVVRVEGKLHLRSTRRWPQPNMAAAAPAAQRY